MPSPEHEELVRALRGGFGGSPQSLPPLEQIRAGFEASARSFRLQSDVSLAPAQAGSVRCEWVSTPEQRTDRAILFLHGGGYVLGSIATHRELASRVARAARARVLLVEYRLAPEHPFPAALDDACAAFRALREWGFAPEQLAVVGDSAGGGLAVATLLALRDAGERLPAAAACLSPWLDLEGVSASASRADDPILVPAPLRAFGALYAGKADVRNPLLSPLHAECAGLPPLLIQAGTREVLLDEAARFAERARAAGVQVSFEAWEGLIHVWPFFGPELPESRAALQNIAAFLEKHWH